MDEWQARRQRDCDSMIQDSERGFVMHKLAIKAREFAANPPSQIKFEPVPYKLIEECNKPHWHSRTPDGIPFDPMEIGDLVVLVVKHTAHYVHDNNKASYSWYPAKCISAAQERLFELGAGVRWKEKRQQFTVWRVPYHWRGAVHKLLGQEFASREALEDAMEKGR